jgi:uncharacterized SAM-binding protein YcdF (DUF218 family)
MTGRRPLATLGAFALAAYLVAALTPAASWLLPARDDPGRGHRAPEAAAGPPADAIVVLASQLTAGGDLDDASLARTVEGVRLYRAGRARLLVLSGNSDAWRADESAPTEAKRRASLARDLGVPAAAILTFAGGTTTRSEVARLAALAKPRGIRDIVLVTDASHMTRAAAVFARDGFTVRPAPLPPRGEGPGAVLGLASEWAAWWYYRLAGYL